MPRRTITVEQVLSLLVETPRDHTQLQTLLVAEFVGDHHISKSWSNTWSLVFVPTVSTVC